jgi:tetratricopeptide (TPR) repeat protein
MRRALALTAGLLLAGASTVAAQANGKDREAELRADSLSPRALTDLAVLLAEDERFVASDSAVWRALRVDPQYARAHLVAGFLPFAMDEDLGKDYRKDKLDRKQRAVVDSALHEIRLAYLIDPFVAVDRINRVFVWQGSLEPMTARERERVPLWFLYWRGIRLAQSKRYVESATEFEDLLGRLKAAGDSFPDDAFLPLVSNDVRYLLAIVHRSNGRTHLATPLLEEVATLDMGHYMAHVRLGEIHEKRGAYRNAVRERRLAMEANPDNDVLLYEYGVALAQDGDLPAADSVLTLARERNPLNARYPHMLGKVRQARERNEEAIAAFEQFLAMPNSTMQAEQEEARAALLKLRPPPAVVAEE